MLRGAALIADAVRVTLGPKSKCVLIEKKCGRPMVCNDSVTIAKEFELGAGNYIANAEISSSLCKDSTLWRRCSIKFAALRAISREIP